MISTSSYHIREKASLEARNGFRVAARAALLAEVRRAEGVAELLAMPFFRTTPLLVLGEGSNTLFAADWPGVALCIGTLGRRVLEKDGDSALLRAEAGERWDDVVRWSLGLGFCGLENLSLIPGTVGAAPIQNIGAYGTEVGEFIETVEAFDRHAGSIVRLSREDCAFGYRDSLFKRDPSRHLVLAVELRLPRNRPLRIDYPGVPDELAAMGIENPRASHVAEAVSRLRTRKLPNPDIEPNVGSFFRNPSLDDATAEAMAKAHPGLPVFPAWEAGFRKISAAWLIEQAGWKGYHEGDAGVSEMHALVLVNRGRASGAQLLDLARRIAASVRERFGVVLEPEARIVGAEF